MYKDFSSQTLQTPVSVTRNYLVLFIVWPFLAFILALSDYSHKNAKRVVLMFLIYYGLSFVVGNVGVDAERYATALQKNSELPFSEFFNIVGGLYSTDDSVDVVESLISFIISRFTDDHRVLFAAFAAFFGFFYLKSINLLHEKYKEKSGINAFLFLAFFTAILPVTTINGFRMWTAAWIFFFGAYHVILYKDPKYIILTLSASFVHWSFLSANAILILYYFAGNRNMIYIPIAIASFVLPQFLAPFFSIISLRLGGSIQNRYEGYSNEDYMMAREGGVEESVWFMRIGSDLVFYFLIIAMIIITISNRKTDQNKEQKNLFSFLLLFLSFVNFGTAIPSFGSRFQLVFFLFATLFVFNYFLDVSGRKIKLLTMFGLFPMILYVAITFRLGSESINSWLFTPGLGVPLFVPELSLADLLFR